MDNGGSNGGKPGEHIRLPSVRLLFPPTTHLILSTMPAIILPPSSPSTPTCATDTLLDLVQQMMQQASRRPAQSMYSVSIKQQAFLYQHCSSIATSNLVPMMSEKIYLLSNGVSPISRTNRPPLQVRENNASASTVPHTPMNQS
jgi:hypothetical protein